MATAATAPVTGTGRATETTRRRTLGRDVPVPHVDVLELI
jgi:hypothetical protein